MDTLDRQWRLRQLINSDMNYEGIRVHEFQRFIFILIFLKMFIWCKFQKMVSSILNRRKNSNKKGTKTIPFKTKEK